MTQILFAGSNPLFLKTSDLNKAVKYSLASFVLNYFKLKKL